jgi:hypothetical protein
MQKPLAITIAACLGLASCQVFEKSETWETVMRVHPGNAFREADPSASYAEKLHQVLLEQGIEHIVVAFQYHYYTNHYEESLGTRTAVVYRDSSNSSYPWWLKDDRLATPFWLPNGSLEEQLSFYARRPVEVLEQHAYPARGGAGKNVVAHFRPAVAHLRPTAQEKPQPTTHVTQVKPAASVAPKPVASAHPATAEKRPVPAEKPLAVSPAKHSEPVTHIQKAPKVASARPKPAAPSTPSPAPSAANSSSWTPPAVIDPVEQASDPQPRDEHLEKLFHLRNGSTYDPTSAVDRRKMEKLKQNLSGRDLSSETTTRQDTGNDR